MLSLALSLAASSAMADATADAVALAAKGDTGAALSAYAAILKQTPGDLPALMGQGAAQRSLGRFADATATFQSALAAKPGDAGALAALADLALQAWDEERARAYAEELEAADPKSAATAQVRVGLRYLAALSAGEPAGAEKAVAEARGILADDPAAPVAARVVILSGLLGPDPKAALPDIDAAIKAHPFDYEWQGLRLNAFSRTNDAVNGGAQMKAMFTRFPYDPDLRRWLLEWYEANAAAEDALAFLRQVAEADGGTATAYQPVIDYARAHLGADAARKELDARLAATPDDAAAAPFRVALARLELDEGQPEKAKAVLKGVRTGPAAGADKDAAALILAEIAAGEGDPTHAARLLDAVLSADPLQTDALKLRVRIALDMGNAEDALSALRAAQVSGPSDPMVYRLLARAYEASGAPELARQALAQAVEKSDRGVVESMALAAHLDARGDGPLARDVLNDSLRTHGDSVPLLAAIGRQQLRLLQFDGARETADALKALGGDPANAAAAALGNLSVTVQTFLASADASLDAARADHGSAPVADKVKALILSDGVASAVAAAEGGTNPDMADAVKNLRAILDATMPVSGD